MLYRVKKKFSNTNFVTITEIIGNMCRVKDVETGEEDVLFLDWLENYTVNKGVDANEI